MGFIKDVVTGGGGGGYAKGAEKAYANVAPPALQQLSLQQYGQAVDPRAYLTKLGPSAMAGAAADPATIAAQNAALQQLGRYSSGQMLPEDIARMRQVQQAQQQQNQAQNQALASMGRRTGTAGSGANLAMQLQAGQGAANQAGMAGNQLVGDVGNRALGAIGAQGGLASQMRGQQFGEASQRAQAIDAINAYNAQQRNLASNQMAQWMQAGRTGNVDLANQARVYNVTQLPQQNFSNQMQLASGRANAINNAANTMNQEAGQNKGLFGQLAATAMSR